MRNWIHGLIAGAVLLIVSMFAVHAATPCSWSSPGLTREEAYRSFSKSCSTPEARRSCQAEFKRAEQEVCKMTRSGQRLKPAPPCNYAEIGVTREQARQTYFSGCETAPPAKREPCKAAWYTHEDEICQMIREWQVRDNLVGLPIGPDASRFLGNAFLGPVDRALALAGVEHSRWMDDFLILGLTLDDCDIAVDAAEEELKLLKLRFSAV